MKVDVTMFKRALEAVVLSQILKNGKHRFLQTPVVSRAQNRKGVKSPSEAVKVRGFGDFRESRGFAVSQTARQRGDLRSISGRKDMKKAGRE